MEFKKILRTTTVACAAAVLAAGLTAKPAGATFGANTWLAFALVSPDGPGSRAMFKSLEGRLDAQSRLIGLILSLPTQSLSLFKSQADEETASSKRFWNARPGFSGLAAGDEILPGVTMWTAMSYSSMENDFAATAFDDDTYSISAGVDKKFTDKLTIGLFWSYNNSDSVTPFNGGSTTNVGVSGGLYGSYALSDIFRVDVNLGTGVSEYDNRVVFGGAITTGTQNASHWYASTSLNADYWIGDIGLGGRLGYMFSDAEQNPYVDSAGTAIAGLQTHFEQVQVSGQVSYYIAGGGIGALPYVRLEYLYDVSQEKLFTAPGTVQPANDRDEIVLGAGISLFSDGPLSGGVGFTKSFARDQFDSWSLSGNISYSF